MPLSPPCGNLCEPGIVLVFVPGICLRIDQNGLSQNAPLLLLFVIARQGCSLGDGAVLRRDSVEPERRPESLKTAPRFKEETEDLGTIRGTRESISHETHTC